MQVKVNYSVLREPRNRNVSGTGPGNGVGVGSSQMQFLNMTVTALSPNQAQVMVESMHGGSDFCIVHSAVPVF